MTPLGQPGELAVGKRVLTARREAGLSQRELASACGVSVWTVESLESRGEASDDLIRDVARALDRPYWWLAEPERDRESSGRSGGARSASSNPGIEPGLERLPTPRLFERMSHRSPSEDLRRDSSTPLANRDHRSDGARRDNSLAGRVALARAQAGLTQRELAERIGASLWSVQRLEEGDERAAPMADLLRVLGRQPAWSAEEAGEDAKRPAGLASARRNGAPSLPVSIPADAPPRNDTADWIALSLVLGSLALLVTIRLGTEVVPVLPRAANFVDVPIVVVLALAAAFRAHARGIEERVSPFAVPGVLLLLVTVVSVVANLSRVQPGPVLVFIYGFLAPLVLYGAVYRLWPVGRSLALSRLLVALGLLQMVVVVLIDLPRFLETGNPDEVSGTFGENAYQLVFFMLVFAAVLAGIYTFEKQRAVARFAPALFVATLTIVFLAQYRALLPSTALVVVAIGALLGSVRARGAVAGLLVAGAFFVTLSYVSGAFPILRFDSTITSLTQKPAFYLTKRAQAIADIAEIYSDHPRYMLTGTGPGTYSSRAWQTFALAASKSDSNVAGGYALSLTGGRPYQTDVSAKYVESKLERAEIVNGSAAVTSPYSSYVGPMAEIGLVGFALIVLVYLRAFWQAVRMTLAGFRSAVPRDPLPALLFGTTVSFFLLLQMGLLENWLEVTRLTFLAWGVLAIVSRESDARNAILQG